MNTRTRWFSLEKKGLARNQKAKIVEREKETVLEVSLMTQSSRTANGSH
jgi:hypothetical protein